MAKTKNWFKSAPAGAGLHGEVWDHMALDTEKRALLLDERVGLGHLGMATAVAQGAFGEHYSIVRLPRRHMPRLSEEQKMQLAQCARRAINRQRQEELKRSLRATQ